MRKSLLVAVAIFLCLVLGGCVPLIVGGAVGAVGGYAASKDTIQGETDKPFDSLWDSSVSVAKYRGAVKVEDPSKAHIEVLTADNSKVYIDLMRLTQSTTRLKVSSRKHHLPNLGLAQDVFVKIMETAK